MLIDTIGMAVVRTHPAPPFLGESMPTLNVEGFNQVARAVNNMINIAQELSGNENITTETSRSIRNFLDVASPDLTGRFIRVREENERPQISHRNFIMPYGIFKGRKLREIPLSYIERLVQNIRTNTRMVGKVQEMLNKEYSERRREETWKSILGQRSDYENYRW